jgi:hypothetical protein
MDHKWMQLTEPQEKSCGFLVFVIVYNGLIVRQLDDSPGGAAWKDFAE